MANFNKDRTIHWRMFFKLCEHLVKGHINLLQREICWLSRGRILSRSFGLKKWTKSSEKMFWLQLARFLDLKEMESFVKLCCQTKSWHVSTVDWVWRWEGLFQVSHPIEHHLGEPQNHCDGMFLPCHHKGMTWVMTLTESSGQPEIWLWEKDFVRCSLIVYSRWDLLICL